MLDETTPIDADDIKPCCGCGKGVMHAGSPVFYEVSIASCVINTKNIQTLHGMEVMFGGAAGIARAMAPSTTVAHRFPATHKFMCSDCAIDQAIVPISLMEDAGG